MGWSVQGSEPQRHQGGALLHMKLLTLIIIINKMNILQGSWFESSTGMCFRSAD
ncbi:hypothetical protein PAESOLCIP111_04223 [Paenibacillus solanacearum]|uniref:Uncharacterized protein n=1 Tax=Paenibacillus solanacearum TaxID=2048548 RepID=A0A916NKF0_9BACL|nr:hypothetical protein PAESOLCIP111_04223 [Paenibacillus solanacearum]